jgi:outer membrane receptor protein involved in Fe transport
MLWSPQRLASSLAPVLLAITGIAAAADRTAPEEIFVTATRYPVMVLELAGNTARLDAERIELLNASHIYDTGTQVPGTWITRGNGQESITAIRSPALTGPGSCGSFLFLEDSLAVRPTGFCNVNEPFEMLSELASAIEVIRGPGNALYGSNAVHGTLNVLLPDPGPDIVYVSGETGPDSFMRGKLLWGDGAGAGSGTGLIGGLLYDHDDGFRDSSGYSQAKGFLKYGSDLRGGQLEVGLSGTLLDQQTAGFIYGENAYRDATLRHTNSNPDAYRKANSQRLNASWEPDTNDADDGWTLLAFLRRSEMDFLQHFLPGQPVEKNGQISGGATLLRYMTLGPARITAGFDTEIANGYLKEIQSSAETGNPPRPQGRHYDYDVWQYLASPYAQAELPLDDSWTLTGGLRYEWLRYDYDNRMLAGNTRDDGSTCTPPCLFNRPADRSDDYTKLAPNIGLLLRLNAENSLYLTATRGFRAPQAAELYRLQAGQNVADLNSESIDSLELGWHHQAAHLDFSAAAFAMHKDHYILQDSNRYNVSDGESRHVGAELDIDARSDNGLYAGLAATWVKQTYAFSQQIAGGENISSGNDIDTAPRTLGSLHLGWSVDPWLAEIEWVHQGRYFLTAEQNQRYAGHDLLNLRAAWSINRSWRMTARINNLNDTLYADRADYAFGDYRYFPGHDRELFLEISYQRGP